MARVWRDDHVDWLRGLHGGPLRVQDRERTARLPARSVGSGEWLPWLLFVLAPTALLLTATVVCRHG